MSSPALKITTTTSSFSNDGNDTLLSRAASYTDLPSQSSESGASGLRRTFSDYAVPTLSDSPTKETVAAGKDILRRTSLRSKKKPEKSPAAVAHFTLSSSEDLKDSDAQDVNETKMLETRAPEPVARPLKARSMSGRIVNLARKPWGSSSRSPSPAAKRSKQRVEEQSPTRSTGRKSEAVDADGTQPSRRRTVLYKRPRRPMMAVVTKGNSDSPDSPSSPSNTLRNRTSFEKFTASLSVSTPILPPMPKGAAATVASFANSSSTAEHSRKKDELWGVFRGLEADFQK